MEKVSKSIKNGKRKIIISDCSPMSTLSFSIILHSIFNHVQTNGAVSDVFNCTFEQGLCNGWKNDDSPHDQFNWTLNKMDTSTEETGPTNDHTVQNKSNLLLTELVYKN